MHVRDRSSRTDLHFLSGPQVKVTEDPMEVLAVIIKKRHETVNSVNLVDCFTVFTLREGVKGLIAVVLYDRTALIRKA